MNEKCPRCIGIIKKLRARIKDCDEILGGLDTLIENRQLFWFWFGRRDACIQLLKEIEKK